jgi:hypothetical protein
MPNKVFISYRREDSRYPARRIYDAFAQSLPPDTVFMDIDSMAPGDDFVEVLEGWVQQCEVLLALIGPNWLKSIDPRTKRRRLDNPEDFVRIEVRGALARKIPVVPVLLDAAAMPTAAELPDDIKGLTRRNAEFIDFRTFDVDVERLIKRLKIGKKIEQIAPNPEPPAEDSGDRKVDVPGPDVPAATSEPDRVKIALLRVWPAVAVSLAVIVAILLAARVNERGQLNVQDGQASAASDALKISESARQEAQAKLAEALAVQDKAEQASKAAEKRANDTADELKKSEKARSDAEDRATRAAAAQAKAEEGQRTAEKARAAAEGAASSAAIARAQADNSRQLAETRANDAAEALKKSEKARQDAEAKVAGPAKSQENPYFPKTPSATGLFLTDLGSSRWASPLANCGDRDGNNYSMASDVGALAFARTDGLGNVDIEAITSSGTDGFQTRTRSSQHVRSDSNFKIGTTWTYSREGERMRVQSSLGHNYILVRCPTSGR